MKEFRYKHGDPPIKLRRTKELQIIVVEPNKHPIPFVINGVSRIKDFSSNKSTRTKSVNHNDNGFNINKSKE